jgi:peptidoglycan/LPS O-acetylase OafA/YrhL
MFFALGWRILMYVTIPGNPMIQYAGTLSRADTLAAGGLAAFLMRHMRADRLRAVVGWLMPVSLGVLVTMYCVVGSSTNSPFTRTAGFSLNAVAFASLILWVVERRRQIQTAVFRLPPLQFLGKISYGVYVLQLPVQAALKLVTGTGLGSVYRTPGQCLLWLCATISVAWLSWKYFEKPVLDWGGKWKTRKIPSLRKAPAQPASS